MCRWQTGTIVDQPSSPTSPGCLQVVSLHHNVALYSIKTTLSTAYHGIKHLIWTIIEHTWSHQSLRIVKIHSCSLLRSHTQPTGRVHADNTNVGTSDQRCKAPWIKITKWIEAMTCCRNKHLIHTAKFNCLTDLSTQWIWTQSCARHSHAIWAVWWPSAWVSHWPTSMTKTNQLKSHPKTRAKVSVAENHK